MIVPTVGRVVWYREYARAPEQAAIVTQVRNDRAVNLAVFEPDGSTSGVTYVRLLQDGDPVPEDGAYCEWMPYQKAVAAVADEMKASMAATKSSEGTEPPPSNEDLRAFLEK